MQIMKKNKLEDTQNESDGGIVHVVFKTHLDIGFTDSAASVLRRYLDGFIPGAIALAEELRERKGEERFVWTTGSWLIYEYLEQADATQRRRMEKAILAGDIAWHAWPFTTYTEMLDPSLCRFALSLSSELDKRFGRKTIAAKMTDVPGHTRSLVPYLKEADIKLLHIGVNPVSPQPDVPSLFLWKGPDSSEVVVIYSGGAYGRRLTVPAIGETLALEHTGDNLGPPTMSAVLATFAEIQAQFPGSSVHASTLDAFAAKLWSVKDSLPVVTSEIGDSWIHGIASDPQKTAAFRALSRLRTEWERSERVPSDDCAYRNFSRKLLLVAEHTWGKDEKVHLPADVIPPGMFYCKDETYESSAFRAAMKTRKFNDFAASWAEQRAYITDAVAALGSSELGSEAHAALDALRPLRTSQQGYSTLACPASLSFGSVKFSVNASASGISLCRKIEKTESATWNIGRIGYQTFSQADYDRYIREYTVNMDVGMSPGWTNATWAIPDFSKPGIADVGAQSQWIKPALCWAGTRSDDKAFYLMLEYAMPETACAAYGAPRTFTQEFRFSCNGDRIELTLQWFGKQACRLPEAIWCAFMPPPGETEHCRIEKIGFPVSPLDVVVNGGRNLHAMGRAVTWENSPHNWSIESLDAPLVAPGEPRLLRGQSAQPDLSKGLHINLYNNIWGTNHPMWSADDARFRFVMEVK